MDKKELNSDECKYCDVQIDYEELEDEVRGVRNMKPNHFNICSSCIRIEDAACGLCGGSVYIPRSYENGKFPSICPDCRSTYIRMTGNDPGWEIPAKSHT